jgi:hypothetical protein
MIPPRPRVIGEDALYAISELERDLAGSLPTDQRERLLFDLSRHHRLAAIGALLSEADIDGWHRHLLASATVRKELLLLAARQGRAFGPHQRASASGPLFDALASGANDLALEIATLSPATWMEDDEFEDDFWHARSLHLLMIARFASTPEVAAALVELQRSASEGWPRLRIARALVDRDQDGFDDGLAALLEDRESEIAELEQEMLANPVRHEAEKQVFVEGIAMVHLAHAVGLSAAEEHRMLPALAWFDRP